MADRIAAMGPAVEAGLDAEQVAAFLRGEHSRCSQFTKDIGVLPE